MSENKSNKAPKGKDWSTDRAGAVQFVFHTHFWGDRNNSGKGKGGGYKRRKKEKKD